MFFHVNTCLVFKKNIRLIIVYTRTMTVQLIRYYRGDNRLEKIANINGATSSSLPDRIITQTDNVIVRRDHNKQIWTRGREGDDDVIIVKHIVIIILLTPYITSSSS